ncbi:MAG TPA: SBBP repeat-containing protein [Chitinophagaceae bacterium]|jgi:gliding motility-associated-like protein|nr:SBBP repeat-containing protein [Chitinophagaceae bacterium]
MRVLLSIFLALILARPADGQDVNLQWVRAFGTPANDYGIGVAIDPSKNVYTVGDFAGTIDFDPGPGVFNLSTNGHFDIFLSKLDVNGDFIWAKSIGASRADMASSIALDKTNNVFYAGGFGETVDFDPGPGVYNLSTSDPNAGSAFISKLDANGNFLWAKQFANADIVAICSDAAGNVYATGGFYSTTDFDPGPGTYNLTAYGFGGVSTGVQDIFVLKLDAAGNFGWVRQMGGTANDEATSIFIDGVGNIYTSGMFSDVADFDPGANTFNFTSAGFTDDFILKLDPNGNFIWAKQAGSSSEDFVRNISGDASGNIYATGNFYSATDFDPGPGQFSLTASSGSGDMFIWKLDTNGNFVWAKQIGGLWDELGKAITVDNLGNVYTTGYFEGTADFDPGLNSYSMTSNGYQDIFILKLDTDGNFIWSKQMGSTINYDAGFDIEVDGDRDIYTTGHFWGTVDFDPEIGVTNLTMVDYGDAFIQKLSQCLNVTRFAINASSCLSYTLNSHTYTKSGVYTQVLKNVFGCDSIITLDLTINGARTTTNAKACSQYIWNGRTYTASGLYLDTLVGAGGCDSIITLDLDIKQATASTITAAICEGDNYSGYTMPGTYVDQFVSANGCDSTRTLILAVKPKLYSNAVVSICDGQTYYGYNKTGTYTDTLSALNGCDSIRTLELTVNAKKSTAIIASICDGESYFVGGANQTISGIYTDSLHTQTGCDSVITTNLIVHSKPNPDLGPDRGLCAGQSLILNPGAFTSYEWQDNSTATTFNVQAIGTYWVKVTDNNNCSSVDTATVTDIFTNPSDFLKSLDSVCQYQSLTILPMGSYKNYLWSTGEISPSITVKDPGNYVLTVTDNNKCVGQDTVVVLPKECLVGFYMPTAFTPNQDGKNDYCRPLLFGDVDKFHFVIYDRWGQKVFETNELQRGWNGNVSGVAVETSVFVWTCSYQFKGQKEMFAKGTVTLIR